MLRFDHASVTASREQPPIAAPFRRQRKLAPELTPIPDTRPRAIQQRDIRGHESHTDLRVEWSGRGICGPPRQHCLIARPDLRAANDQLAARADPVGVERIKPRDRLGITSVERLLKATPQRPQRLLIARLLQPPVDGTPHAEGRHRR